MNDLRTAAQQALEALEYGQHSLKQVSEYQWESRGELAMQALRAALAQQAESPCACWPGRMCSRQAQCAATVRAQQAEPVEPVAWLLQSELDDLMTCNHRRLSADSPTIWAPYDVSSPSPDMGLVPVYAAPPQRKPLTDEKISDLWCEVSNTDFVTADTHVFARAVERAHGVKE